MSSQIFIFIKKLFPGYGSMNLNLFPVERSDYCETDGRLSIYLSYDEAGAKAKARPLKHSWSRFFKNIFTCIQQG